MNRLSSAFAESRLVGSIAAVMLAAAASGTHAAPLETLTIAVNTGFTTMDPWDATDNLSRTAARSFYESLYTFDKNLKPTPQLAESVDISPDGRIYTFKLRQGVKFHDGTILDAEAVKLSFELGASQDLKRTRRNFFNFVEKIEAADKYTVRFTLKSPMTAFLERLSNGTAAIACPSLLARAKTKQALAFEACGTGPYKLVRFNPAEELLVERNPDYRVPGLPKFKALRWVPVVENSLLPSLDTKPPLLREHRLYQADWLLRFYGFQAAELLDDAHPDFDPRLDPKCNWALRHLDQFPVEVMRADLETLLRVPGIGPTSARRIVSARRCGTLRFEDLKKLGVVLKRAQYFITCGGRIPEGLHFSPATLPLQLERLERDTLPSDQAAQLSLFDPVGEAV